MEVCWYNFVRASHIAFVMSFSAICGTTWSLTLSRMMLLALAIASSYLSFSARSTGIAIIFKAKSLRRFLSRTDKILAFQTTNFEAQSSLSWSLTAFTTISLLLFQLFQVSLLPSWKFSVWLPLSLDFPPRNPSANVEMPPLRSLVQLHHWYGFLG